MLHRGAYFLCLCIAAMQLLQDTVGQRVDPEVRAHLEARVMSEMSLKHLEEMVERDERVMNSPQSKFIIVPKPKHSAGHLSEQREALIIQRKPKKAYRQEGPEYRFADIDYNEGIRRSSFEPSFEFESGFRREEDFPSLFKIADLESSGSSPVRQFYESIVESVLGNQKFGLEKDPFDILDIAASESVPEYKPRFDYDAYSKDSTETKLQGKPYWKDAPERKDEMVDENGCRTVIKKIVDPEDEKKSSSDKAKSVVITKECEYPNLNGPDAKITEARPIRLETSRFDSEPSPGFANYNNEPSSYEKSRPEELNSKQTESSDPLASDYIDSMLEKHFKSFPGFTNPITSFKGYQDRFKLRAPEAFKDIKPTVGVQTYEYTHPKSGFEDEGQGSVSKDSKDSPRVYEHHYNYDYPERSPREPERSSREPESSKDAPKVYEHHYNYDYPERSPREPESEYEDEVKPNAKSTDPKDPKMMKKSFAYYRKDNPKSDPDDHQFAEEYAQGNYRSFSSSYDSEKDGPKKKQ